MSTLTGAPAVVSESDFTSAHYWTTRVLHDGSPRLMSVLADFARTLRDCLDGDYRAAGERALACALGRGAACCRPPDAPYSADECERSNQAAAMRRMLDSGSLNDPMSAIFAFREGATETNGDHCGRARLAQSAADALLMSSRVAESWLPAGAFRQLDQWAGRLIDAAEHSARPIPAADAAATARLLAQVGGPGGQDSAVVRRVRKRLLMPASYGARDWELKRLWLTGALALSTEAFGFGDCSTAAFLAAASAIVSGLDTAVLLGAGRPGANSLGQNIIDRRNVVWVLPEFDDIDDAGVRVPAYKHDARDLESTRARLTGAVQDAIRELDGLQPWVARVRAQYATLVMLRAASATPREREALLRRVVQVARDTSAYHLEFHRRMFNI